MVKKNRLTIGLDIDGVIVDYAAVMLPLLSEVCNRPISHHDINAWDLTECLNIDDKAVEYIWQQTLGTELLLQAPPIEGAIDGISRINRHEIWIITGRPAAMQSLTESWLNKRQIMYDNIAFVENGNKMSAGPIFDVFVEDYLEEALIFANAGILTLLFNQPWNWSTSLPQSCQRVNSWSDIVQVIDRLESEIKG